jgi:hypothetical protein
MKTYLLWACFALFVALGTTPAGAAETPRGRTVFAVVLGNNRSLGHR